VAAIDTPANRGRKRRDESEAHDDLDVPALSTAAALSIYSNATLPECQADAIAAHVSASNKHVCCNNGTAPCM
jgi:hypothetical protein